MWGATAAAPAVAPGGDRVAFVWETADSCVIAMVPLAGGMPPRVVSRADYAWDPAWSPDGAALVWHEWDLPAMPWDASRIVLARPDDPRDEPRVVASRVAATSRSANRASRPTVPRSRS